jgi:cellulose synthase/poly-beta-1,6-N-acetylglucosamine synthase-like glycosyltransferase
MGDNIKKIIFCLPGSNFTKVFLESLIATISYCMKNKISISVKTREGSNIYALREEILGAVYDKGTGEISLFDGEDYDYIMNIDSDMRWRPQDLQALIDADKDIVSGVCARKSGEVAASYFFEDKKVIFKPTLVNDVIQENIEIKNLIIKEVREYDTPVTISACGFAFLLVKKGVFEKMEPPWFMQIKNKKPFNRIGYFSEDYSWCVRAYQAGYKVWLHPKARIGHQKEVILTT